MTVVVRNAVENDDCLSILVFNNPQHLVNDLVIWKTRNSDAVCVQESVHLIIPWSLVVVPIHPNKFIQFIHPSQSGQSCRCRGLGRPRNSAVDGLGV